MTWIQTIKIEGQPIIAIDGKVSRRNCEADTNPLRTVSTVVLEARLILGQVKV